MDEFEENLNIFEVGTIQAQDLKKMMLGIKISKKTIKKIFEQNLFEN